MIIVLIVCCIWQKLDKDRHTKIIRQSECMAEAQRKAVVSAAMDDTVQPQKVINGLEEIPYRPEEVSPQTDLDTLGTPYRDLTTTSKHFRGKFIEEHKEDWKEKQKDQDDDFVFRPSLSVPNRISNDLGTLKVVLDMSEGISGGNYMPEDIYD